MQLNETEADQEEEDEQRRAQDKAMRQNAANGFDDCGETEVLLGNYDSAPNLTTARIQLQQASEDREGTTPAAEYAMEEKLQRRMNEINS